MDPRFPIGKFARPGNVSDADRARSLAAVAALPGEMAAAVAGLTDAQLDTPYRPGGWTVRQVVHHVADSHLNAYTRFRLALTETNPTIKPYAEAAWAELPDARTQPVDVSLALLASLHQRWSVLLTSLSAEHFSRPLTHPESGPQTLDTMLALYDWHGRHHTAHITELRKREGWS
jgi:uncharacterized damage-inducible protein DinB